MILSFRQIATPAHLVRSHAAEGGKGLALFVADVGINAELRVMTGREPLGHIEIKTHVSVSVGRPGVVGAFRCPTDEEMNEVKSALFSLVDFEKDNEHSEPDSFTRHLWEK